jgi:hypothetical protein
MKQYYFTIKHYNSQMVEFKAISSITLAWLISLVSLRSLLKSLTSKEVD